MKKKIIKVGVDLDGVIIGKPPFVPKEFIEWLYRSHKSKKLRYRYPGKIEECIRWLSHIPLLRPPLIENIEALQIFKKNNNCRIVAISSRFKFLEGRTYAWFRKHNIEDLFDEVYLNLENDQPHFFKEKMLKTLRMDYLIDDDIRLVRYLKKNAHNTKILHMKNGSSLSNKLKRIS